MLTPEIEAGRTFYRLLATYDAQLFEGPVCPRCGHRDHGRSGCDAALTSTEELRDE